MTRPHSNSSHDDKLAVDSVEDSRLEKGSVLAASNEAGLVGPHVKSKAEKRLVLVRRSASRTSDPAQKQDLIIIPQLMFLYFMAFVDRGNLVRCRLTTPR